VGEWKHGDLMIQLVNKGICHIVFPTGISATVTESPSQDFIDAVAWHTELYMYGEQVFRLAEIQQLARVLLFYATFQPVNYMEWRIAFMSSTHLADNMIQGLLHDLREESRATGTSELFQLGFVPVVYLDGRSAIYEEARQFRQRGNVPSMWVSTEGMGRWEWFSLADIERRAISEPLSLYQQFTGRGQFYEGSCRAWTDMQLFNVAQKSRESLQIAERRLANGWYRLADGSMGIPVTRYTEAIDRGKHHGAPGKKKVFLGTFYYNEPESTTLLTVSEDRILVGQTKTGLYMRLVEQYGSRCYNMKQLKEARTALQKKFGSLLLAWTTWCKAMETNRTRSRLFVDDCLCINQDFHVQKGDPRFVDVINAPMNGEPCPWSFCEGRYASEFYAAEDGLDQALARLGQALGYDVLIIEKGLGRYRLVKEILDTRPRMASFESLRWI